MVPFAVIAWLAACTAPPAPTAAAPAPTALEGTRWFYEDLTTGDVDAWEFDPHGALYVASGNNPTPDTWTLEGDVLTVNINDYARCTARRTADGAWVGDATNPAGATWRYWLTPDVPPARDGCGDDGPFDVTDSRWREHVDGAARPRDTVFFLAGGAFVRRLGAADGTWTQQGATVTWTDAGRTLTGTLYGDHSLVASDAAGRVRLVREPTPGACAR